MYKFEILLHKKKQQKNKDLIDMKGSCKVCRNGVISQGILFCEACRSFFRRNRNRPKINCQNGLGKCLDKPNIHRHAFSTSGHRNLCKGCRLEKCLQLEHQMERKRQSSVELVQSPVVGGTETMFVNMMNALKSLKLHAGQMKWRQEPLCLPPTARGPDVLQLYLDSIKDQVLIMKQFAMCFPVYTNLTIQDRVALFLSSQFRIILGESLIHPENFFMGCFSSANFQACLSGK